MFPCPKSEGEVPVDYWALSYISFRWWSVLTWTYHIFTFIHSLMYLPGNPDGCQPFTYLLYLFGSGLFLNHWLNLLVLISCLVSYVNYSYRYMLLASYVGYRYTCTCSCLCTSSFLLWSYYLYIHTCYSVLSIFYTCYTSPIFLLYWVL